MKILFVAKHIPYRPDSGITIKINNLLSCMSRICDVSCVYIVDERERNSKDLDACRLHVTNHLITSKTSIVGIRRYIGHLIELFALSGAVKTAMSRIIEEETPDLVWLEFGYIGHLIPFMKKFGLPVIYGSHNSQFKLDFNIWKSNANIRYRLKMAPFILFYLIHEKLYFKLADLVLCISEQDMAYYARIISPSKLRLMPFLFSAEDQAFVPPLATDYPYVCMVGSLQSYQNYSAAIYALEEVWPILSSENDRIRLYILGELPPEGSKEYQRLILSAERAGRVILTGWVESVIPFVKGAAAHLVPLHIGSGVRTKIIESVACGTPVVSTTIGAEGLPFVDGESIFLDDTAAGLAQKVLQLVNDHAARSNMADKAFATYRNTLSCKVGMRIIEEFLHDLNISIGACPVDTAAEKIEKTGIPGRAE